jgi:uncharacterized repeat protein (TIGR01451 family)
VDGIYQQPEPVDVVFEHLLPDIAVPGGVEVGLHQEETITQTFSITNDGKVDLVWEIAAAPAAPWLAIDPVNDTTLPGESTQVVLNFEAISLTAGVYTTTLEITSNDPDEQLVVVPVTLTVDATSDLVVGQSDDYDPVEPGGLVVYTILVQNNGPANAENIVLIDTLPVSATFIIASGNCSEASGIVTCDLGTLVSGQEISLSIVVQAPDTASEMFNQVEVTSVTYDPLRLHTDTESTLLSKVLSG